MRILHCTIKLFVFGAVFLGHNFYAVQAHASSPLNTMQLFWKEVQRAADLSSIASRDAAVEQLFKEHFDFEGFYRRALVDHWDQWSDQQKQDFSETFQPRFIQQALSKFHHLIGKHNIKIVHRSVQQPWGYIVSSSVRLADESNDILVSSYLNRVGSRWKIMDLNISGALMSRNYRGQFNNILRRFGYADLLVRLRYSYNKENNDA